MKKSLISILFLSSVFGSHAQMPETFCEELKVLIAECENNFADLTGEIIYSDRGDLLPMVLYASNDTLAGSVRDEIFYSLFQWIYTSYAYVSDSYDDCKAYYDMLKDKMAACLGEPYLQLETPAEERNDYELESHVFTIEFLTHPEIVISLLEEESYVVEIKIYSPN